MNQPPTTSPAGPRWLLLVGLLLGAGLLVFMTVDVSGIFSPKSKLIVRLTDDNWHKEVTQSDVPVVVDFTGSWCGPCMAFKPTLESIARRYEGKVKVGTVDVGSPEFDNNPKLVDRYEAREGIPLLLIFNRSDEPVKVFRGAPTSQALTKALDAVLQTK